jgi:cold shock CspA family protein
MDQAVVGKGRVDYVNSATGCGFIVTEDTVKDVLFLPNAVIGSTPEVGQEVRFEIVQTIAGPRARKLREV